MRTVSAVDAAHAISRCIVPARAAGPPPSWLFTNQVDPWRRLVAALGQYRAAVLAEPVGRGKTYIALAAAAEATNAVTVIAPAILESQWHAASGITGIRITFHSHERLSRGRCPSGGATVIIDEAHRLRSPASRRSSTIAPWLPGHQVILCTATPIVNRVSDLLTLLDLVLPDDALSLSGIPSLTALADVASPPACLSQIVIRSVQRTPLQARTDSILEPSTLEEARAGRGMDAISQLRLSTRPPIARLIRVMLIDALASSDAAFLASLRRYQALLEHSIDAGGASRALLRRFAGPELEQTALWSLLTPEDTDGELTVDDAPAVRSLLTTLHPADQGWISSVRRLQLDDLPMVCFTRHRATALALRHELDGPVAWISGTAAGVGAIPLPRGRVLDAFGPHRGSWRLLARVPRVLVATDVAAEGLDLQGAGRIIHIDTPWTAMRMQQREGRLIRLGQQHACVNIVHRLPARSIETALAPRSRVHRKATIAERWLEAVTVEAMQPPSESIGRASVCVVATRGAPQAIVVIRMTRGFEHGIRILHGQQGSWSDGTGMLPTLLQRARAAPLATMPASAFDALIHDAMSAAMRDLPLPVLAPISLVRRIHDAAGRATRERDSTTMQILDRMLQFLARRQCRGGRALVERLDQSTIRQWRQVPIPTHPPTGTLQLSAVAALVFRSAEGQLR